MTDLASRPLPNVHDRTVFFVSDGTGITAETFGHSLLAQFESMKFRPACRDEQILEGRDADGSPRYACVMARGADARAPLPLIVLFHGPEGTPRAGRRRDRVH